MSEYRSTHHKRLEKLEEAYLRKVRIQESFMNEVTDETDE